MTRWDGSHETALPAQETARPAHEIALPVHETALRTNSLPSPPAGEGPGVRGACRQWPRIASGHCVALSHYFLPPLPSLKPAAGIWKGVGPLRRKRSRS